MNDKQQQQQPATIPWCFASFQKLTVQIYRFNAKKIALHVNHMGRKRKKSSPNLAHMAIALVY